MRSWLPGGHLALFILDMVLELDLSTIYAHYAGKDDRGRAGYPPTTMVSLLIYLGRAKTRGRDRCSISELLVDDGS